MTSLTVDKHGKVTVSLGGVCTLACGHCYTMTKQFQYKSLMAVDSVIQSLVDCPDPFTTICISGDVDPFLKPKDGVDLVEAVSEKFPTKTLMFTTRLIPPNPELKRLDEILHGYRARGVLGVPCVSIITMDFPNPSESASKGIPPGVERMALLSHWAEQGIPTILAMRPTFPLELVSKEEIDAVVAATPQNVGAVLGEIFLLDQAGQIERRLSLPKQSDMKTEKLHFISQPSTWKHGVYEEAITYTRESFKTRDIPFFMRSPTAIELLQKRWDLKAGNYQPLEPKHYKETIDWAP